MNSDPSQTQFFARRGPRPLSLHATQAEKAWRTSAPRRLTAFYLGVESYRHHPYRRAIGEQATVWKKGGCRLLDGGPKDGWPLLIIPSLINRSYILDLMPHSSFVSFLRERGIRPLLIDWGPGCGASRQTRLEELIIDHMRPALAWLCSQTERRPFVLGYCMGGTLAAALACLSADRIAGLALLATPWDFNADRSLASPGALRHADMPGLIGSTPVDWLQAFFAQIDPLAVPRKFVRFTKMRANTDAAMRFVAIEDWLNDGVPLSAEIANECCIQWYGKNAPASGNWKIDGFAIEPQHLDLPAYLAIPERDPIVPPNSAMALADILRRKEIIRPKSGHVGMIAGSKARTSLWIPFLQWLRTIAAKEKNR